MYIVHRPNGAPILTTPDRDVAEAARNLVKGTVTRVPEAATLADLKPRDVFEVRLDEHGATVDRSCRWRLPWDVRLGGEVERPFGAKGEPVFVGAAAEGFAEAHALAERARLDHTNGGPRA